MKIGNILHISTYGYYGQSDFRTLANKIGIVPIRRDRILTQLLSATDKVVSMIDQSFLSDTAKEKYKHAYKDKIIRMGMTSEMIEFGKRK